MSKITQPNSIPSFSSSDLFHALKNSRKAFERYHADLDAVSSDIKELETYFNNKNIGVDFSYDIEPHMSIGWRCVKDKFRLVLIEEVFVNPDECSTEVRPLIELPAIKRLRVHEDLPQFVQAFATHIRAKSVEVSAADLPGDL